MGPRKLLREGILTKAKSGRRLRGFLCSDILVLTDEGAKALYRTVCIPSYCPCPLSLIANSRYRSPKHKYEKYPAVEVRFTRYSLPRQ